ncbi:hypothetical protein KC338_g6570 [Hortaea werneckii]|nr:hypothetical protein KC323_g7172 [Hortaea werneckii]KAI6861582.1 hypothetical protein KC338_g6570 [Hortaea werneckii]KAI7347890.1 hypothetical protein KC320_g6982 [Hortaea werneckii]
MAEQNILSLEEFKSLLQAQKHAEEQLQVAEEQQRGVEDAKKEAENANVRVKEATERVKEATERVKEATEREKEATRKAEELMRKTTFDEYIKTCHDHLSKPLQVRCFSSRATNGGIGVPTAKYYCPTELRKWDSFDSQQAEIYNTVRRYLQPADTAAPRLFTSILSLKDRGRRLCKDPLSGQGDLERVEQFGKELDTEDVVSELCKTATAREELGLGQGLKFRCHTNVLDEETSLGSATLGGMQRDQSCVHRLDGDSSSLLMIVDHKPPHKLSTANLCAGLRPMRLWEDMVDTETVPTDRLEKLQYNATRLTGAALVQQYHLMIQEGLAYSCVSTGIALVSLHVPEDDPTTLCYHLSVPNEDVRLMHQEDHTRPLTAVARLLCLSLMSCVSPLRSHAWRNHVKSNAHIWETDFEHVRAQIPDDQLYETPPGSEYVALSPVEPYEGDLPRHNIRLTPASAPSPGARQDHSDHSSSSVSDVSAAACGYKRNHSQVTSSPPKDQARSFASPKQDGRGHAQPTASPFCTQRCLLGLQKNDVLDTDCPNISCHRQGRETDRHLVDAGELVRMLKKQLDEDVDEHCEPLGECGATGAPFRLRCKSLGYTIIGKGTTSTLWNVVAREAQFYQILRSAQGSAIPVFLGELDMKQTFYLHGAGEIQHMLLMAWGGEPPTKLQWDECPHVRKALKMSHAQIWKLGVRHGDLRRANVLWNEELNRLLIIDFHKSTLIKEQVSKLRGRS